MPLTHKGKAIMSAMDKEYGAKKGKKVFYATRNKGKITGVEKNVGEGHHVHPLKGGKGAVEKALDKKIKS